MLGRRSASDRLGQVVPKVAGALLLLAAAAKLTEGAPGPLDALPYLRPLRLAGVWPAVEVFLGGWLLCGAFPRTAWAVGGVAYTAFAAVSLHAAASGQSTCGCFGSAVAVSPWLTAAVDLVIASLLLIACLSHDARSPVTGMRQNSIVVILVVAIASALATLWFWHGDDQSVEVDPAVVEMGTVSRGRFATATVVLTNRSGRPVILTAVKTSCPCVKVTPQRTTLWPGERVVAEIRFDTSAAPAFTGLLAVEATGVTDGGRVALRLTVHVAVTE
jgi:hypothetical protein